MTYTEAVELLNGASGPELHGAEVVFAAHRRARGETSMPFRPLTPEAKAEYLLMFRAAVGFIRPALEAKEEPT